MAINNQDIVFSSRIRLARNYQDIPFPSVMNDVWAAETVRRTLDALSKDEHAAKFRLQRMQDLQDSEKTRLVEEHVISPDLAKKQEAAALTDDEGISIMIGEEDHLRIQACQNGFVLDDVYAQASKVDDIIDASCEYAFDDALGYLTACPTNTGTGLRASVMLHLPALTMTGQMKRIAQNTAQIGLTLRGFYGEGSEESGNLYQLSNQITLGRSEEDIVSTVKKFAEQLIGAERDLRAQLYEKDPSAFEDRFYRAFGVMRYARKLNSKEFMALWSELRMGAAMGILAIDIDALDDLLFAAQNAHVAQGVTLTSAQCDIQRADICRDFTRKTEENSAEEEPAAPETEQ